MADDDRVPPFDGRGNFIGKPEIVFSESLQREADEQDKWLASIANGSEISIGRILLIVLQEAVLANASYIHIHPRQCEFVIRYRIGSKLWEANSFPKYVYAPFCARLKIISNVNIAERRIPQFGSFLYEQSSLLYELRMSSIPTQQGEAFVINILQQTERGDYAIDRHEWQDQMTVEDVLAQIQAAQQREPE